MPVRATKTDCEIYGSDLGGGGGGFSWRVALPFWLCVFLVGYLLFAYQTDVFRQSLPLPPTGPVLVNQVAGQPVCRVTIRTPGNDPQTHYLVKFEDPRSTAVAAIVFVRGGQSVRTMIASGAYRMQVASGTDWFGMRDLFGSATRIQRARDLISVQVGSERIINLSPVVNGNLPMDPEKHF